MTNIERLVGDYFRFFLTEEAVYNHRPDWLKWTTGNNLELDIYYPSLKFAIEVNGKQHKLLEENRKRDAFKKAKCHEMGIYLFVIWHPRELLNSKRLNRLGRGIHRRINISRLPADLLERIETYKPKDMPFMRAVRFKARMEVVKSIQDAENALNRAKAKYRQ